MKEFSEVRAWIREEWGAYRVSGKVLVDAHIVEQLVTFYEEHEFTRERARRADELTDERNELMQENDALNEECNKLYDQMTRARRILDEEIQRVRESAE